MAVYRTVQTCFWTDPKIGEDFTANERLLYLFLLTGPSTNLAGCYELTMKQITFFTGLNAPKDLVKSLQSKHKVIAYSEATKEVLILNWWRYNWTSSDKFRKSLYQDISNVKDSSFKEYLMKRYSDPDTVSELQDTVSADEGYGIQNTVSALVSDRDTVLGSVSDPKEDTVTEVIEHLNEVCGTSYKPNGKQNREHVHARLADGFTKEDCFEVIDKMHEKWGNDPKMRDFLRPQTLFSTKFESYLNMPRGDPRNRDEIGDYLMGVIHGQGSA